MSIGLLIALIVFFVLMLIGTPMAYCFAVSTLTAIVILGLDPSFVCPLSYQMVDSFTLMAVLFFMLAGDLMGKGEMSGKLINLASAIVGRLRAGLGAVMVLASTFFGALSGSATATTAAIGGIMIPQMEGYGYQKRYSCALAAATGWLGSLIPPSINAILYAMFSDQSIAALFLSTVVPGLILAALYVLVNSYYGPKYMHTVSREQSSASKLTVSTYFKNVGKATSPAIPALITPVIILGGIYGGVFTPTEAGAIGCLWAVIAGAFIYRKLKMKDIVKSLFDTAVLTASLLLIVAFVAPLMRVLVLEHFPQLMQQTLLKVSANASIALLFITVIILILGMFLDAVTLTVIIAPLFIPTMVALGVNLVHFGAIINVSVGIGSMTPPMAIAIFVASRIGNVPFKDIIKPIMPFIIFACLPTLALTTYIPALSLWLPRLIMGAKYLGG